MSALAIDPNEMSSDLRTVVYSVVEHALSTLRADAYINIYEVFTDEFGDEYYDDQAEHDLWTEESLANCTCLYCGDQIQSSQLLERLYLFESGKPAFYMCEYCEEFSTNPLDVGSDEDDED